MTYRLIKGEFVLHYEDLPCQGPEPDGDTLKFVPDDITLVESLPQFGGTPPRVNGRGAVNLRFEALDALETHYPLDGHGDIHQHLALAIDARDHVLATVGFDDIVYCDSSTSCHAESDRRQASRPQQRLARGPLQPTTCVAPPPADIV